MFNVQSKTDRQEVSLVYCTNQTKRLMKKTKKKTIEESGVRKGMQSDGRGGVYGGKDLRKSDDGNEKRHLCQARKQEHVSQTGAWSGSHHI